LSISTFLDEKNHYFFLKMYSFGATKMSTSLPNQKFYHTTVFVRYYPSTRIFRKLKKTAFVTACGKNGFFKLFFHLGQGRKTRVVNKLFKYDGSEVESIDEIEHDIELWISDGTVFRSTTIPSLTFQVHRIRAFENDDQLVFLQEGTIANAEGHLSFKMFNAKMFFTPKCFYAKMFLRQNVFTSKCF